MRHPDLSFQPLSAQTAHADAALRKLLQYLQARSPFYRRRFAEAGVDPAAVRTTADLQRLPTTDKSDMQRYNDDFRCVSPGEIREYMSTSGTLGPPVTIALTENDLRRLAYNEEQSFRTAGLQAGDVVQLALTLDRQFMAGAAYYSGLRSLGAASVRTGPGLPAMQWETLQRLRCSALVAVPSFLLKMIDWAASNGLSPADAPVSKVICIGESLRLGNLAPNALATAIAAKWPVALHGTYASTEMQTAFTECSAGAGGHHQPDLVIVEILDEAGAPLPDGQTGEVTVTTLGVEGMPLLRFRTGDMAALHAAPCSCGRHSKRLGPVVGRRQQMIKYRGTTLYPPAIMELLAGADYISDFVVEAYQDEHGQDSLRILLSTTLDEGLCLERLRPLLQAKLRVAPAISFVPMAEILALQLPPGARKLSRFVDRRPGT